MDDQDKNEARGRLKRAVARAAPAIAGALGGPLAGAAVERLSRAIFGSGERDESALEDALKSATPEQLAEILRADREFALALRQAAVEEQRVAAGDRANARSRQQGMGDATPAALGGLIIAGFFVVLAAMLGRTLPPGVETEFSIMLGALATMTAAVVNYFFGSSAGSKEKTRMMLGFRAGERE